MAKSKEDEAVVEEGDGTGESAEKVEETSNGDEINRVLDELANLKRDSALASERLDDLLDNVAPLDSISADTGELLRFREVITGVVNKLYRELDESKRDPRSSILKPVVKDLILFHDDMVEVRRDTAEELGEKHITTGKLDTLIEGLLEALYRMDVEPYEGNVGSLDLASHKTVNVEAVSDKDHDKRIMKVVRRGFVWPEGILRREEVIVGKYVGGEEGDSQNDDIADNENGEAGITTES